MDIKALVEGSLLIDDICDEATMVRAWDYLKDKPILTHANILNTHRIIVEDLEGMDESNSGAYRGFKDNEINVYNHGRLAPDYTLVDELMKGWLFDVYDMTPLIGLIRFTSIQPFNRGSGAVGRVLYWWICQYNNVVPYVYTGATAKDLEHYQNLFNNDKVVRLSNMGWILPTGDSQ